MLAVEMILKARHTLLDFCKELSAVDELRFLPTKGGLAEGCCAMVSRAESDDG